ncbi:hypothetical protein EV126DRAFT_142846 [Verticillium dahliae]|nr:hypothetical protein EV126DRAFT_142846 [Verticillium dahliae]
MKSKTQASSCPSILIQQVVIDPATRVPGAPTTEFRAECDELFLQAGHRQSGHSLGVEFGRQSKPCHLLSRPRLGHHWIWAFEPGLDRIAVAKRKHTAPPVGMSQQAQGPAIELGRLLLRLTTPEHPIMSGIHHVDRTIHVSQLALGGRV